MVFQTKITEQEKEQMFQWAREGVGYAEISKRLQGKISKQRVYQLCKREKIDSFSVRQEKELEAYTKRMKALYGPQWEDATWRKSAKITAAKAKYRAKKKASEYTKWGWNIEFEDLDWPDVCPVLGIELDYFADSRAENSVSFDRLDPTKGYVKGNVAVMSWRANRIKNDGTAEEHKAIYVYLKNNTL